MASHDLDMFKIKLGENIEKLRKEKELSFECLSQYAGISKSYAYNVECGYINPSIWKLMKIAEALGTDVNTLIS